MRKSKSREYYETASGSAYITFLYRDLTLTDDQAAKKLGISRATLSRWKSESKIISQAIDAGKAHVDTLVENRLLKAALEGNTTAMIYWLKNRKPDKWNERLQSGDEPGDGVIIIDDIAGEQNGGTGKTE